MAFDCFLLSFFLLCSGTPDDLRRAFDLLGVAGVAGVASAAYSCGFSSSLLSLSWDFSALGASSAGFSVLSASLVSAATEVSLATEHKQNVIATQVYCSLPLDSSITDSSSLLSAAGTPSESLTSTFSSETSPTTASSERAAGALAEAESLTGDAARADILKSCCWLFCDVVAVKDRGSLSVDALRVVAG